MKSPLSKSHLTMNTLPTTTTSGSTTTPVTVSPHMTSSSGPQVMEKPVQGGSVNALRGMGLTTTKSNLVDMQMYRDTDTQLRAGLEMIQGAYTKQRDVMYRQTQQYQSDMKSKSELMHALETEVKGLRERVRELESSLKKAETEKREMEMKYGSVVDKLDGVKRMVVGLEKFRKSIVSMVEKGVEEEDGRIESFEGGTIGMVEMSTQALDYSLGSLMEGRKETVSKDVVVDAPRLYRQIRQRLSAGEFETFAGVVAMFNGGKMGAEEAVDEVERIVGKGELSEQMKKLIYRAVEEVI